LLIYCLTEIRWARMLVCIQSGSNQVNF